MSSGRRKVPDRNQVPPQFTQTIKEESDGEHSQKKIVCLDAAPHSQFRYSCWPNLIRCLSACDGPGGTTVVAVQWGYKRTQHQMKAWMENPEGTLCLYKSTALDDAYKIHHLTFIPSQEVVVCACSDLSLRVFSEPEQGMTLRYQADLLSSVFCMHYSSKTEEVLTGSMGMITFWGFWGSPEVHLGVTRILDWNCCSLHRDTAINAVITARQTSTLYALCGRTIKSFGLRSKKELRAFEGRARATLHCVASDRVQRYLYTGDISGRVQIWSQASRTLLQEFQAHFCPVSSVAIRPNKHTLLTASSDGWVKEWNSCGQFLFKLSVDDPGGVRTLWPVGEHRVLCHSPSSFAVWRLQDIYRPFHESFCTLRHLRRVECGLARARLLATSQTSLVLLSPVSGDTLVFSWPFLFLQQALDFAYDPSQDELFVADGTSEVTVLDMTRCPSPVKQIVCTRIKEENGGVMCLEAVMLGGESWTDKSGPHLVFSGHRSGTLQLLSPHRFHCIGQKVHSDAVVQISSVPGRIPQLCCYGADRKLSVWAVGVEEEQIELTCVSQIFCNASMTLTRLTPGFILAVSQEHCLLSFSILDGSCSQLERISSTPISCMDHSSALGLVVISGPAGTVEVWDTHGILVVAIKLGAPVSQVCFVNPRGDLLACFNNRICIIPGVRYLPVHLLKQILAHNPPDDLLEDPVPFLPQSFSGHDLGLVPGMFQKPVEKTSSETKTPEGENSEPETNTLTSRVEIGPPNERTHSTHKEDQGSQPYKQVKSKLEEKTEISAGSEQPEETNVCNKVETSLEPITLRPEPPGWPIAPDGYVPNSVIRNWGQNQEPDESEPKAAKPKVLQGPYVLLEDAHQPKTVKIVPQSQAARISKPSLMLEGPAQTDPEKEEIEVGKTLLQQTAESPWLVEKPKTIDLDSVLSSLTLTMGSTNPGVYDDCAAAICSLNEVYGIPPETKEMLGLTLLESVQKGNPNWKRLRALKILFQLRLLKEKDVVVIAEVLMEEEEDLQQLARGVLAEVFGIKDKDKLLDRLCSIKGVSKRKKLLKRLDEHLTGDLQLQQNVPAVCPEPTREVTVPVSSGGPTTQHDDISAQIQQNSNAGEITRDLKRHVRAQPRPPPDPVRHPTSSTVHLKPTHHIRKKQKKFIVSFPKKMAAETKPEVVHLCHSDSIVLGLYKKIKTRRLTDRPLLLPKPDDQVSTPPTTSHQPEFNCLEPIKGQGEHNWRENLHHLISLHGVRSSRIVHLDPPPKPAQGHLSCTLPPIPSSPTVGQRVVERIWLQKTPLSSQFHHIESLPGQGNVHTLDHTGESQYGLLKVDWRAGLKSPGMKLAPIRAKMAL